MSESAVLEKTGLGFTANVGDLRKIFETAASIVNVKAVVEIHKNVLVEVADEELIISTADFESRMELRTSSISDSSDGKMLFLAEKITKTLKVLDTSSEITFVVDSSGSDSVCNLICGKSKFKLYGYDPDLFDSFPSLELYSSDPDTKDLPEKPVEIEVRTDQLVRGLSALTAFTESGFEQFVLSGVALIIRKDALHIVGTDSRRLGKVEIPADFNDVVHEVDGQRLVHLIPPKQASIASKFISHYETVTLKFTDCFVLFETPEGKMLTSLQHGQYPNYDDFIPTAETHPVKIVFDAEIFNEAVKHAMVLSPNSPTGIQLCFQEDDTLALTSRADAGESDIEITYEVTEGALMDAERQPIEGRPVSGYPFVVGFVPNMIAQGLKLFEAGEVALRFKSDYESILIQGDDEDPAIYTLMPL